MPKRKLSDDDYDPHSDTELSETGEESAIEHIAKPDWMRPLVQAFLPNQNNVTQLDLLKAMQAFTQSKAFAQYQQFKIEADRLINACYNEMQQKTFIRFFVYGQIKPITLKKMPRTFLRICYSHKQFSGVSTPSTQPLPFF